MSKSKRTRRKEVNYGERKRRKHFTNITATPVVKADSSEWHGNIRVQYDSYEASSLASGSDITVARLPKGAKVYDIIVHFDALGGSSTVSVGDADSAARYIAAVQLHQQVKCLCLKKALLQALDMSKLQKLTSYLQQVVHQSQALSSVL